MPLTATGARAFLAGLWGYLSLHTGAVPTHGNEISGGGYARAGLAWEGDAQGVVATAAPVFAVATEAWPEVFSLAVRDSDQPEAEILAYVGLADGIRTPAGRRPAIARELLELAVGSAGGALRAAGVADVYGFGLVRGTWLALHTAAPEAGDAHELDGNGYARVALADAAPFDLELTAAPQAAYTNPRRIELPRSTGSFTRTVEDRTGALVRDGGYDISRTDYLAALVQVRAGASVSIVSAASDGTTLWLVNGGSAGEAVVVAFDVATRAFDSARSLDQARLAAIFGQPPGAPSYRISGIAADDTTLYLVESTGAVGGQGSIRAASKATYAYDATRSYSAAELNAASAALSGEPARTCRVYDLATDDTYLYVGDRGSNPSAPTTGASQVLAFTKATRAYVRASVGLTSNINAAARALAGRQSVRADVRGLATDGTTLWIADGIGHQVIAMTLSTGVGSLERGIATAALQAANGDSLAAAQSTDAVVFADRTLWAVSGTSDGGVRGWRSEREIGGDPVTHFGLWDAQTAGELLYAAALSASIQWPDAGSALVFDPNALTIDFTGSSYVVLPERAPSLVSDRALDLAHPDREARDRAPSRHVVADALAHGGGRDDEALRAFIREVMGQVLEAGAGLEILPQVDGRLLIAERGGGAGPALTRYIAAGLSPDFTAGELAAGGTSTTRTLTVPTWPAGDRRYLALAYPAIEGVLRTLRYGAAALNQAASWEALASLSIAGVECRVYRLYGEALHSMSGVEIHLEVGA